MNKGDLENDNTVVNYCPAMKVDSGMTLAFSGQFTCSRSSIEPFVRVVHFSYSPWRKLSSPVPECSGSASKRRPCRRKMSSGYALFLQSPILFFPFKGYVLWCLLRIFFYPFILYINIMIINPLSTSVVFSLYRGRNLAGRCWMWKDETSGEGKCQLRSPRNCNLGRLMVATAENLRQ